MVTLEEYKAALEVILQDKRFIDWWAKNKLALHGRTNMGNGFWNELMAAIDTNNRSNIVATIVHFSMVMAATGWLAAEESAEIEIGEK